MYKNKPVFTAASGQKRTATFTTAALSICEATDGHFVNLTLVMRTVAMQSTMNDSTCWDYLF